MLDQLHRLGITTVEELRDHWTYNSTLLMDFLGDSPVRFAMVQPALLATRGGLRGGNAVSLMTRAPVRPIVKRPRGVVLRAAQRRQKAVVPSNIPMTRVRGAERVFFADHFPPVRDQGHRGTCVAFATLAYLEYHLYNASQKTTRHSEQFVYWACKEIDEMPKTEGTMVSVARQVLKRFGACLEETWSYRSIPTGPTEGQGPPPDGALAEAKDYRWQRSRTVAASKLLSIRKCLDRENPVVLAVKTFPSWDYPSVEDSGEILMPLPGEIPDGGHAVCVVGYEVRAGVPGGGALIFRNSWGPSWARRSGRFGPGYGTLFVTVHLVFLRWRS